MLDDKEERKYRNSRLRTGLRMVSILEGSYQFDPVVSEEQRQWWRSVAVRYLDGIIRYYSQ